MCVVRVKHQTNYVVINKTVLEDPELSFKAKGLWAYCMSRPDHWEFHVTHLATVSKDGEDAVYSAIKELEKAGYVKKIQKNENGKFGPVDYEILEIKIILPLRDFPDAGNPRAGNPALVSNDSSASNEKEKVVCIAPPVGEQIEPPDKKNPSEKKKNPREEMISLAKESSDLPQKITKSHPDGTQIEIVLAQIFTLAVTSKKDWTTREINDAWKILVEYKGLVRDGLRFIEGTIDNLRNKKRAEHLNGEKKCKKDSKIESKTYDSSKAASLVEDLKKHPSLQSLLEAEGLW